nr:Mor transcription activator family protein [Enterocloster bolteae]
MNELAAETTLDDISESYRPLVEMIGLGNVLKLSQYFMGDKMYIPKVERILSPARNRRIRREYNGYNTKELAQDYDLTTNQILQIVRDMDPQQISLFDIIDEDDT